jgi:hypothetical protein
MKFCVFNSDGNEPVNTKTTAGMRNLKVDPLYMQWRYEATRSVSLSVTDILQAERLRLICPTPLRKHFGKLFLVVMAHV